MKASILVLCLLPLVLHAIPCTDPPTTTTPEPSTTTTPEPFTTTTPVPTTTDFVPPPKKFPKGTYALVRPDAGCPQATGFKYFHRYWDTEDYRNANVFPSTDHMAGFFKSDGIQLNFCVKTKQNGGEAYDWPAGDYCIVKKGDCPTGFNPGAITWDDENSDNKNNVFKNNQPDGVFDKDTELEFCCRDDGSSANPIKLPVTKEFYLIRYKGPCQEVAQMDVVEEAVGWDDEDSNNQNTATGAHPLLTRGASDNRLHFCYYSPEATSK